MTKLSGNCLCGDISFQAEGDVKIQANCHCVDCRQVTGAAYATLLFMNEKDVKISGHPQLFEHQVENGNVLSKLFCPKCGSQMFGKNSARPGSIALRAGSINETEEIQPQFNVFTSQKIDGTHLDPNIPAFDRMPS